MRQYLYIVLFIIVLAAPFVLRAMVKKSDVNPATARNAARLVVITPNNQDIRREFGRAFSAWHLSKFGQAVEIDFRTPGATNDIKRQLEDTYRSYRLPDGSLDPAFTPDIHVVWGGGPYFFDKELKAVGILQPMRLDPALLAAAFPQPTLANVRLYEETVDANGIATPRWVGLCLSAFGIVYNPDIYQGLGLEPPKQWHDLTDPRLFGQLALADPTHSGSAATAYMIIMERRMADAEAALFARQPELEMLPQAEREKNETYQSAVAAGWKRGMGELLLIAANGRYFVDSAPQVPSDIGNGDAAAGIAIDFYGRVYEDAVGSDRCRVVMPVAATAITPDPVAILEGVRGEPLTLATRFVEYLLTPEGQRLWILRPGVPGGPVARALRRPPVRRDVYDDRAGWTDDVNPFTEAHGFNQRPEFETLFSDTRPVWTAAWIESRETLKTAYAKILRVSDSARRAALLAELADLPIDMEDVANDRAERKRLEQDGGNAEEWKARKRIERVKLFRSHYSRVADKAQ